MKIEVPEELRERILFHAGEDSTIEEYALLAIRSWLAHIEIAAEHKRLQAKLADSTRQLEDHLTAELQRESTEIRKNYGL